MSIPRLQQHVCLPLLLLPLLLLSPSGPLGAQPVEPAARSASSWQVPEAKDAWGNTLDAELSVEKLMMYNVMGKMGSPAWVPLAMRILQREEKILPRLYWSAAVDLLCGRRYKQANPQSTAEQYMKFKATPEGVAWTKICVAEVLDDPHTGPQIIDGMVASLEVALTVPMLLMEIREQRIEQGLDDVPEPTPEMREKLPRRARMLFRSSACLVREALKKAPIGKLITEPAVFQAQVLAAMNAGLCDSGTGDPADAE